MLATDSTDARAGADRRSTGRRRNELAALSALAFEDLARFPGGIRDMHLGIAERSFRSIGVASRPVQIGRSE